MAARVAIVGGGVIGTAVAWYAARAGHQVELYERGALGGEATRASAGILAPLAESVTPGPFVDLALAGLRAHGEDAPALLNASGLDPEYRHCGVLRLAHDRDAAIALQAAADWQANRALDLRWLEPRQLASLEPGLAATQGGLLSPNEGHVHPFRLTRALTSAAVRAGAAIHEYTAAAEPWLEDGALRGLRVDGEHRHYDQVVLATGAWSAGWSRPLGLAAAVRPVKGQMLLVRTAAPVVSRVVFAGHSYLVPRADGTTYVGATQEEAGFDRRVTAAGLSELLTGAVAIAPSLADAEVVHSEAGLRPGSADGLPLLGPAPAMPNLILACGHFRNGILMALITGRIVTALLEGRAPELDITPFSPGRFTS